MDGWSKKEELSAVVGQDEMTDSVVCADFAAGLLASPLSGGPSLSLRV
jgi:hypothetical protein